MNSEMKQNGFDHSQNRQKWRCPLACGTKIRVKRNVLKPSTVEHFIPLKRTIYGCLQKHLDHQKNGHLLTNVAHPLNVQINEKKSTTTWSPVGIAQHKCGTSELTAS